MAINMMCMNDKCVFYYEDNCIKNLNEERIEINESGQCETFKEGINDLYNPSNLRVYFDGDSTWYATPWDKEKTLDWLIEKLYLDEDIAECLEECDLDDGCMWYETNDQKDIKELGDYDECGKGGKGDLRKGREDKNTVERLMSFREVIKLQGDSETPYIIASTDY